MAQSTKPLIFVSYRRADSPDTVKLLVERLKQALPQWEIFYDHQCISPGEPFAQLLKDKVTSAEVVLIVIGPQWLAEINRRTNLPGVDHVREEVRLALDSGHHVVPIIVGNAKNINSLDLEPFPDLLPLAGLNARPVRPEPDFDHELDRLIAYLEQIGPGVGIGTILDGKYKLLREIGVGGMGIVYAAEQLSPRRTVAVKLIKPGMDSREVLARFDAERQALAVMDHPCIAKVLDAGTTIGGRPYFVMEHVPGLPINQYCDQHKLSTQQRLVVFQQVCDAVQHAHQKGILHRDIKPTNVLVEGSEDRPAAKVIDFGLAKALGHKLTDKTLFTTIETRLGTLEYSSPEQAAGRSDQIDTRTDIYSLGVLLYELLVGEPPFSSEELQRAGQEEMLRTIRERDPPRPSHKLSSSKSAQVVAAARQLDPQRLSRLLRGELDWIVMKALEKEPRRRYETANALARDVAHLLAHEPVEARPPSRLYLAQKFVRRNWLVTRRGLLAACLLIAAILVAGVWTLRPKKDVSKSKEKLKPPSPSITEPTAENNLPRIAVLYFEDQSIDAQRNRALSKGLCSIMTTGLSKQGDYEVVERERIQAVLDELKLTRADSFDQDNVAKIGKLLGADQLLLGSYFDILGTFRIDARLVDVETGVMQKAAGVEGRAEDFSGLVDRLLTKISGGDVEQSVINQTDIEEQTELPEDAIKRLGDILEAYDRGERETAFKQLESVRANYPAFEEANALFEKWNSQTANEK